MARMAKWLAEDATDAEWRKGWAERVKEAKIGLMTDKCVRRGP